VIATGLIFSMARTDFRKRSLGGAETVHGTALTSTLLRTRDFEIREIRRHTAILRRTPLPFSGIESSLRPTVSFRAS
jgi:hypothetical protein